MQNSLRVLNLLTVPIVRIYLEPAVMEFSLGFSLISSSLGPLGIVFFRVLSDKAPYIFKARFLPKN